MRNRSVRDSGLEPKFFQEKVRTLLADEQSGRVGIGAKIIRANTQIDALEVLSAVDVKTLVDDATLMARLHGASSQTVPSGFDVVRNPVVDSFIIICGILDIVVNADFVGSIIAINVVEIRRVRRIVPSSHVDANSKSIGVNLFRSPDVNITTGGRRVRMEARVVGRKLASEGVHPASDFTSLLVAPTNRCKIGFVVHEATVKGRLVVRIVGGDVNFATTGRVFQILEHSNIFARRQKCMVGVGSRDDGTKHDWFVGLVLEISVP
jgi:hypothetical protein